MMEDNDLLIGVAAVKRPNDGYKKGIFEKAQTKENPSSFSFEIGWIVIEKNYQRQDLSHVLMKEALQITKGNKVFATTITDNQPMRKTNKRYGFNPTGNSYPTNREGRNYSLTLFLKNEDETEQTL